MCAGHELVIHHILIMTSIAMLRGLLASAPVAPPAVPVLPVMPLTEILVPLLAMEIPVPLVLMEMPEPAPLRAKNLRSASVPRMKLVIPEVL